MVDMDVEKFINKYKQADKLFISFSGGETSAYMTKMLLENVSPYYDKTVVLFANTGQENEETLEFVDRCDREFGFGVVWVEADVQFGERKGTKHKVVDFDSASRDGEPFEDVIRKYGVPNQSWPHCTRELKLSPMTSYVRSLGWKKGDYDVAIGIRVDEIDRMSSTARENNIVYPLVSLDPKSKPDINTFWRDQNFRLNLKGYQGNCKWCWKKSFRKHFALMEENLPMYDFPMRMEQKYGWAERNPENKDRVFFRKNTSTKELMELKETTDWVHPEDDSVVYSDYLDRTAGCTDSCEVNFEEYVEDEI